MSNDEQQRKDFFANKITVDERAAVCAWLDMCDEVDFVENHFANAKDVIEQTKVSLERMLAILGWAAKIVLDKALCETGKDVPSINTVINHKEKIIDFLLTPKAAR